MAQQVNTLQDLSDQDLQTLMSGTTQQKSAIMRTLSTPLLQELSGQAGPGEGKVPSGFRRKDIADPTAGVERIPGIPETPEKAAKIQQVQTAVETLPQIEGLLFDPDGSPNRTNLFTGSDLSVGIPFTDTDVGFPIGVPGSEGRELRSLYEVGIQAITRSETGAAMAESELENTRTRFQPNLLDSEETVKRKFEMFKDTLQGSLKLMTTGADGQPRLDEQKFDSELKRRGGQPLDALQREAEEAIRQGADPQAVKEELERLRAQTR